MKKGKEPRMWTYCAKCDKPYGFVNCPVVVAGIWWCLRCRIEEQDAKRAAKATPPAQPSTGSPQLELK